MQLNQGYVLILIPFKQELDKISRIARVIIAGNSIDESLINRNFGQMAKYLSRKIVTPTVEAVQALDNFLSRIAVCTCHMCLY